MPKLQSEYIPELHARRLDAFKISKQDKINYIKPTISYIVQCRQNYFDEIYPADEFSKTKEGYQALIKIAKSYFDKNLYDDFSQYFMEGQYFIALWTAHLILEYGNPNPELKSKCYNVIVAYSDNPLSAKVSLQEKQWLDNHRFE